MPLLYPVRWGHWLRNVPGRLQVQALEDSLSDEGGGDTNQQPIHNWSAAGPQTLDSLSLIPYPLPKVSLFSIQCLHRIPYPYLAAPDAVGSAVIEGGTGPRERERERHTHTA